MKKYVAIVFVLSVFWLSAQEISDSERLQKTILHLNEKHGNEFIQDEWKIKVKKQRVVAKNSRRIDQQKGSIKVVLLGRFFLIESKENE